jgi:lipoprotein-releasing system permease protein
MKLESYIAKRYLLSKHKVHFITIISMISVVGITLGVAALIVVLSVFNGFGSLVTSFLMSFDPHIRIEIISDEIKETAAIEGTIKSFQEIKDYAPFVSGKVLAYSSGLTQVVSLKGIEESKSKEIFKIDQSIIVGEFNLTKNNNTPQVVLGIRLADKLQVLKGDTLMIISPAGIERAVTQFTLPQTQRFIVSGIYNSNNNEYDESFIFCSLNEGQKLLGYRNTFQGYDINLKNIDLAFSVKERLQMKLSRELYSISTWYDFHKELYSVMQIERWTAYIILSLIIAVSTFNILGSLSMTVIEKKRDIGVLRSMGISEKSILKIFMYEGLLIGIIGTIAGAFIGWLICYLQITYNIYPLDPTQYKIDSLPLEIRYSDFFFISLASMLLAFLASLYPAKRAAKVNPIEAIKWE